MKFCLLKIYLLLNLAIIGKKIHKNPENLIFFKSYSGLLAAIKCNEFLSVVVKYMILKSTSRQKCWYHSQRDLTIYPREILI